MILFGRVTITLDGTPVRLKTGAKFGGIGGFKRTSVVGETVHGFVESAEVCYCEFSITADDEVSPEDIHRLSNTTLIGEVREGPHIGTVMILRNAYSVNAPEVTAGEGETPFRFESAAKWEIK